MFSNKNQNQFPISQEGVDLLLLEKSPEKSPDVLSREEIESFGKSFLHEISLLRKSIDDIDDSLKKVDPTDEDRISQINPLVYEKTRIQMRISQFEDSLSLIESGRYGKCYCTSCNSAPIDRQRMLAIPTATKCVASS
jgi:RNA polymerase-binding transcription factor DksA